MVEFSFWDLIFVWAELLESDFWTDMESRHVFIWIELDSKQIAETFLKKFLDKNILLKKYDYECFFGFLNLFSIAVCKMF